MIFDDNEVMQIGCIMWLQLAEELLGVEEEMTKSRDAIPPSVVILLPAGYGRGSWLWLHMFKLPLTLLFQLYVTCL